MDMGGTMPARCHGVKAVGLVIAFDLDPERPYWSVTRKINDDLIFPIKAIFILNENAKSLFNFAIKL